MNITTKEIEHPLSTLVRVVNDLEDNFTELTKEFSDLKNSCLSTCHQVRCHDDDDHVPVSRNDIERLQQVVATTKRLLPDILSRELLTAMGDLQTLQQELMGVDERLELMTADRDHWKSRYDAVTNELNSTRKARMEEACRVNSLSHQLTQQSEYSAGMGAACATLLWRVSRRDDAVQSLLTGVKVDEFLETVSTTVETYSELFSDGAVTSFSSSDEAHLVLALTGVIINIAACPFGRELLTTKDCGRRVIDVFVSAVYNIPSKLATKLKSLMLMAVYNVSINQKGFNHLRSKPSLITQLAWLVQCETDVECRLNALRLILSIMSDDSQSQSHLLIHEAREVLSEQLLYQLTSDKCSDIKDIALDLINTLHSDDVEP